MKQQKKSWSKKKIIIVAIASLAIAFVIYVLTINISGSTKPIREVADKFQPPSDWQLIQEEIVPPRIVCWDSYSGKVCPEISRSWEFKSFNLTQIQKLLDATGWSYRLEGRCSETAMDIKDNAELLCFSHTINGSYDLYFSFDYSIDTKMFQFILSIHKR